MIMSFLFAVLMLYVFGKLLFCAFKMTWGITKIIFRLLFLPIILIVLALSGFMFIAFPLLILVGLSFLIAGIL